MHRPDARSDWARFQERWLDYAQQVKAQWPEISFADILATRGDRHRLCRSVQQTYGLDPNEADRAVTIWQHAQTDREARGDTPPAPSPV